ncbi:probable protein phosphatase CG10417 [Homarus americanus]|uniref:probable protein phosphatase CG10417 n=1 Tax=Homarus americanus TaxID=6706 RepID=UPI001C47E3B5|nr:probable protein phosphatase CG10417 [Homarus americanus]
MGAYLSEPVTEKLSSDEDGDWLKYGASSMQGWRVSQEDAHNSILDYDKKTHLFAVYDGHGGHEVAAYTALKLPDFLKETEAYKNGLISQALTDTFLGFDATLVKPEVVSILKQIAGTKDEDEEEEEDNSESESEEMDNLYREATMPLDEVIAKYAENPQISRCKKEKGVSPFLKAKSSKSNKSSDSESPVKFALEEEDAEKSPVVPQSSSSGVTEESNTENVKVNSEGNQNGTKVETDVEVNGDETKHMVNGEGGEEIEDSKKIEKTDTDEGKLEECKVENGDTIVNGGEGQETGKGKGKGGKGGKGKAVLKNSEVQAMKAAKAKEKRREAAIKAAEIYRKIQEGGAEEDLSDEEEDDEDDNFEDEGGEEEEGEEDADGEESEDEDDDEEEEDVETEDDEDPYTEFAMNMKEEPGFDSGCTACVALIQEKMLYVANVGDSRCVVSRNGKAVEMSLDHKPEDDPEAARIIKAGGRVTADGRVNGGLNLSRAIGDHGYKQNKNLSPEEQMISPLPDVRSMALEPEDNFMIVACDGIWNSLSSQEACDFVSERLNDGTKITKICEELFDHCLAPDTHGDGTGCDNMTCIIISFKDKEVQSCGNKRTSKQADNDDSTQDAKKVKSDGE